jgi:hypothetical protein
MFLPMAVANFAVEQHNRHCLGPKVQQLLVELDRIVKVMYKRDQERE